MTTLLQLKTTREKVQAAAKAVFSREPQSVSQLEYDCGVISGSLVGRPSITVISKLFFITYSYHLKKSSTHPQFIYIFFINYIHILYSLANIST